MALTGEQLLADAAPCPDCGFAPGCEGPERCTCGDQPSAQPSQPPTTVAVASQRPSNPLYVCPAVGCDFSTDTMPPDGKCPVCGNGRSLRRQL